MEALRQRRPSLRSTFSRTANLLDDEMKSPSPDFDVLAALLEQLKEKGARLAEVDNAILALFQDGGCTQEEYDGEFAAIEAYSDRLIYCRTKVTRLLSKCDGALPLDSSRSNNTELFTVKRKYRLPEIELKKFGGDVKDWLGFWGQFKKIHDDEEVDSEDKYQYLIQATVIGSRARELVESFPPIAENYPKAIDSLKSRYGRDDTLVEVYVRELLRLVLNNALNAKQKVTLTALYDKLESQLRALDTLGVTTDKYAAMLYPLVESCLPEDVLRAWERNRSFRYAGTAATQNGNVPDDNNLSLMMNFLRNEVDGEERIHVARTGFGLESDGRRYGQDLDTIRRKSLRKQMSDEGTDIPIAAGLYNVQSAAAKPVGNQNCVFCDRPHASQDCRQAINMSLDSKKKILLQRQCCFVCLKGGHRYRTCKSKIKCAVCEKRHFALMCPETTSHRAVPKCDKVQPTEQSVLANQNYPSEVMLQTMMLRLEGRKTDLVVRALIDTGSQRSYVSNKIVRTLGLKSLGEEKLVHNLFGGAQTVPRAHNRYLISLTNLTGDYNCELEVLDQEVICGIIPKMKEGQWAKELQVLGIILTDIATPLTGSGEFESEVQVLLGADIAGKLLTGRIEPLTSGPVAVETYLGWTLMGAVPMARTSANSTTLVTSLFVRESNVADLWKLDSLGITDPAETRSREELQEAALEHFNRTVRRDPDGRYEISLPWLDNHPQLPMNRRVAERRLQSTVKKLNTQGRMEAYQAIFKEWLAEQVIERVPQNEQNGYGHYLPHRAVFKETSETTKLRPVFDASAHEKNSPSLNDCLEKGPNLIELIPSILLRFRIGRVGVIADIKKAFLQIGVREEDRDFLRFLWCRDGNLGEIEVYRHRRVVFGVSSSPFLLGAVLSHVLEGAPLHLKETAKKLGSSMYVDNCVASFETTREVLQFIRNSQDLMSSAMFDLRAWKFNELHTKDHETEPKEEAIVPVLGLLWDLDNDTLSCDVRGLKSVDFRTVTKRSVLSIAHQVFDPLGFTCAFTLCPKLILQETWQLKMKWDDELPSHLAKRFQDWTKQLSLLEAVKIPRCLFGDGYYMGGMSTLHVFCDASKLAYATCIYLRVEKLKEVSVQLVQARARVAPVKAVTIPRLELLACVIGARLAATVKMEERFSDLPTVYWLDSTKR